MRLMLKSHPSEPMRLQHLIKPDYRSNELIALFATDYGAVILSCVYNKQTNEEG